MPLTPPMRARRKARAGQPQKPRAHPFAIQYTDLRQALGELAGRLHIAGGEASLLDLRLPSTEQGPLPSPEVILEEEVELKPAAFMPYEIPTLALAADPAFDTLLALPDHAPHGVAYGGALRYWLTAARFAYELIARQCYMPALQETLPEGESGLRAAWTAVLAPEDEERARQLALMMPSLCWSWLPPGDRKAALPHAMLRHFLNQAIDAFVRGSLVSTALLSSAPSVRKPHTATRTLPERWLQALTSDDPTLTASGEERRQFVTAMRNWLGQIRREEKDAPFRTCFRLDPPLGED